MAPQSNPDAPAGQPEDDRSRLVLLDRLLAERFPGMPRKVPALSAPAQGLTPSG